MSHIRFSLAAFGLALLGSHVAALPVTYVSVEGENTAPCTRAEPCRTFAGALPATDRDGTVVALDSGVFSTGHLDIRQPVILEAAPGVHAHLLSKSFAAVSINVLADERVVLRGLTLTAVGDDSPLHGIVHNGPSRLQVERCVIRNFASTGLHVGSARGLSVTDTLIQGSSVGVFVEAATPVVLDRVQLEDNDYGVWVSRGGRVTMRDSVVRGSTGRGVSVYGAHKGAELTVVNCVITHNAIGAWASAEGKARGFLRLSDNTITNNDVGIQSSKAGIVESRGNNTVRGNGVNIDGMVTPIAGD